MQVDIRPPKPSDAGELQHAVFVWAGYRFMLPSVIPSVCESMVTAVAVKVDLAAQSGTRVYLRVMTGAVVGEMKSQRTKT